MCGREGGGAAGRVEVRRERVVVEGGRRRGGRGGGGAVLLHWRQARGSVLLLSSSVGRECATSRSNALRSPSCRVGVGTSSSASTSSRLMGETRD